MATTQPIRNKKEIQALANYYYERGQFRNHVLVLLCVYTALRISDLLRLRWDDVFDFTSGRVLSTITITEKKTKKSKIIALNQTAIGALTLLSAGSAVKGRFIIENQQTGKAISRIQAYRLIRAASEARLSF